MISTKGRYALSTLIDIAEQEKKGNPVSIKEVAERQGISVKYLEQIIALKDESDCCSTDHRLLVWSQIFYLFLTEKIRARGLNIKKSDDIHQGGFPAP